MFQRVAFLVLFLFPSLLAGEDAIRGFISVEPFELRLEAIVEVAPFRDSWRIAGDFIEAGEKQAVLDNIATLFESGVNLFAAEEKVSYTERSVRFLVTNPETGYRPDERTEIPVEEALVGITLSSDLSGVRELRGEWLWFAPGQDQVVLEIASRAKPSARLLERGAGEFSWSLDPSIAQPQFLETPAVIRTERKPLTHAIWVGLLMLAAAAGVVIQRKQHAPSWVGWLVVGGIVLGIASVQLKIERVDRPDEEATEALVYGSLRNVYHAFDFRDESRIYDTLEKTVTGPLLEKVYLEVRASLELENLGGPRVKVYEIALREWKPTADFSTKPGKDGLMPLLANWATIGEVTHWGHTHERTNRYEAKIVFEAREDRWMVAELELLNEERVQKVSRRKAVTEGPAGDDGS